MAAPLAACGRQLYPGARRHVRALAALFAAASLLFGAATYVALDPNYCADQTSEALLREVVAAEGGRLARELSLRSRISELQSSGTLPTLSNVTTHLLTVANKEDRGLDLLRLTSSAFGWQVHTLGTTDARIGRKGWGTGFGLKILYQQQYAASLPPGDLLIFVDAFDVLTWGGVEAAVEGYLRACARAVAREDAPHRAPAVLFSAERACTVGFVQPHVGETEFPCLCSGAFMGAAADVARLLSLMVYNEDGNDQEDFTAAYLTSRSNASWPLVVLDHEADVFLSMFSVDAVREMTYNPIVGRWRHVDAEGTPVFAHWNGWIKLLDVSLDQLMGRQYGLLPVQWPWCRAATPHDVRKRTLEWLLGLGGAALALASIYCVVMESALAAAVAARVRSCRGGGGGRGGGWQAVPMTPFNGGGGGGEATSSTANSTLQAPRAHTGRLPRVDDADDDD